MKQRKETRIEIIDMDDETKRKFVRRNCKIEESIQDNGRTLKLFISSKLPITKLNKMEEK